MGITGLIRSMALGTAFVMLSLGGFSHSVEAQPQKGTQANIQETDDKDKVDTYTKFVETYRTNRQVAYETAKGYLQRHGKENDQYSQYVTAWVADYEKELHRNQLWKLAYTDRNFVEAFKLGKQVMVETPDHLDSLIALGNAGFLAVLAQNGTYNVEALAYAQKAIQMIESGNKPESWEPFKGKDDTLAYLYSTIGLIKLKGTPNEAIDALIKTAQLDSELKKDPLTYFYLEKAYQTGPYAKLSAEYQSKYADKPETPESKQALEKLNLVIDRIVDALARAVATAGDNQQYAQRKATWMTDLTNFYKFRHDNSDAGLTDYISKVLSTPLPPKV